MSCLWSKVAWGGIPKMHFPKSPNAICLIYSCIFQCILIIMQIECLVLCVAPHHHHHVPSPHHRLTPKECTIAKAWRPLVFSVTESLVTESVPHLPSLLTTKASVPELELRGSGSLTQGNTMQNPSVYSSAQESRVLAECSSLIGTPATSSARYRVLCIFHWT